MVNFLGEAQLYILRISPLSSLTKEKAQMFFERHFHARPEMHCCGRRRKRRCLRFHALRLSERAEKFLAQSAIHFDYELSQPCLITRADLGRRVDSSPGPT